MTDRTVSVELLAKMTGYTSSTDAAAASTTVLADAMERVAVAEKKATVASTAAARAAVTNASAQKKQLQALTTVGKGFLVFGVAASVSFGLAAKAATEFQRRMALVDTLAGKQASGSFAALSNAALHAGQAYGYTANQVADAQAELVKAGISVKDILGGALQGTLTLAAAGQINVAEATEIAASAMTQFALKGKDVPHIADLLAAGADKALGSVGDLGLGLSQVGTTAHQFGFTLDDTVAVLAEFAQQGQLGQKAGTELNQALLQLAAPTKQAQSLMDKYGFSVYTAQGHFKSFADLANSLQISFGRLSDQQRNQALATIFGSRAIRAANILYQDGATGVTDWEKRIQDSGFAVQQATGKLNSLSGDLLKLKAAFQTGLIEEGSGVQDTLRGIVHGLTDVVTWFDKLSPAAQSMILEVTGVASVFGLAGGAALIAIPKIVAFQEALATLRGTALSTAEALGVEAGAESAAGNAALKGGGKGVAGGFLGGISRILGGGAAAEGGSFAASSAFLPIAAAATAAALLQFQHKEENDRAKTAAEKLAADPKALAAARANLAKLQAQQRALSGGSPGTLAGLQQSINTGGILPGSSSGNSLAASIAKQKALVEAADAAAKKLTVDNYALDKGATAAQIALNNQDRATATGSLAMFKAGDNADALASAMIAIGSGADAASPQVKALAKVLQTDMDNAAKAFTKDLDPIANFKGGDLAKQFGKAITAGRKFNTEIRTVSAGGLDPTIIQKLIAEGPAQAGPVLQKLVGKNSAAMIKMANAGQSALDSIEQSVVDNARLVGIAENATTDAVTRHLGAAEKINAERARLGGHATAAQLAAGLHMGLANVYDIAGQYGIGLLTGVKKGTDASTSKINSLKGDLKTLSQIHSNPKISLSGKEQVLEDMAAIQGEIDRLAGLHVINIVANAKINLAISGKGNAGAVGGWTGGTFRGGWFDRYSGGGSVFGGPPGRDTNFARLDTGEEVIRRDRAEKFRPLLKVINNAPGLASGGTVGSNLSDIFAGLTTTNAKGKSITSTLGAQFSTAVGRTTKRDGAFISNLDTLAAKGFGFLAMQLLESGDPNAKAIAAQAVKWSSSHLRVVQAGLQRSAAEQKQLGLLPAELAITSALRTSKSPTLASIAAATGLDPSDLQAGLIAMSKSLRGNKNAGALLSGLNSTGVYSQSSWGNTTAGSGPQFTIVVPKAQRNPYSFGEKVAIGAQRVLAVSSGSNGLPRW